MYKCVFVLWWLLSGPWRDLPPEQAGQVGKSQADVKRRHWCLYNDQTTPPPAPPVKLVLSRQGLPVSFYTPSCQKDKLEPWTICSIPGASLPILLHKSQLPGDSWKDSTSGNQIELSERALFQIRLAGQKSPWPQRRIYICFLYRQYEAGLMKLLSLCLWSPDRGTKRQFMALLKVNKKLSLKTHIFHGLCAPHS